MTIFEATRPERWSYSSDISRPGGFTRQELVNVLDELLDPLEQLVLEGRGDAQVRLGRAQRRAQHRDDELQVRDRGEEEEYNDPIRIHHI